MAHDVYRAKPTRRLHADGGRAPSSKLSYWCGVEVVALSLRGAAKTEGGYSEALWDEETWKWQGQ